MQAFEMEGTHVNFIHPAQGGEHFHQDMDKTNMDNSYSVLKVFLIYALRKQWWQQHHHHQHYCYYYYFVEVWPVLGPWPPCCWGSEITKFSQCKGARPMFNIQPGQPRSLSLCPVPCSKPAQHRWPYQQLSCHWRWLRNNTTFHCSNNIQMQGILFYQYKNQCSSTGNSGTYEDFKPILFEQLFLPLKNLMNW